MKNIGALCLFGLLVFSVNASGNTVDNLNPRSQAIDYVNKEGGIAVLVSIGTKDKYTGDQVGQAVTKKFSSMYDVPITYFVRHSTGDYGYLEFYMWKAGIGPYWANQWNSAEKIQVLFKDVYITYLAAISREVS